MSKGINKRKRTSTGRRLSTVQQTEFNNLTARYGTPMSVVVRPTAPLATRGFYGSYSRRGRSELKVIENAVAQISPITSAGNIVCYNLVAQGTDFVNRVGRLISLKSLLFRMSITSIASASNPTGDISRVMIIYDSQPNSAGAVPAVTDVLTTADIYSGINLNNRDRFRVLWDKRFVSPDNQYTAGNLTSGAPRPTYKEKFMKLPSLETCFSGTGGTIGNIASGSLLMLNIGVSNNATTLFHYARVRFTDQ